MKKTLLILITGFFSVLLIFNAPAGAYTRFDSVTLEADCQGFTISGNACTSCTSYPITVSLPYIITVNGNPISGSIDFTIEEGSDPCTPFATSGSWEELPCGEIVIEGSILWAPAYDNETFAPITLTCRECPSAISLNSFTAQPDRSSVTLLWETDSEDNNEGFNILRSEAADGEYEVINADLIPAEGSALGAAYGFVDENLKNRTTYYYMLEDIDSNGSAELHGPINAKPLWLYGLFR